MEILIGLIITFISIQYIVVFLKICDGIYDDKADLFKDLIPFYFWIRIILRLVNNFIPNLINLLRS